MATMPESAMDLVAPSSPGAPASRGAEPPEVAAVALAEGGGGVEPDRHAVDHRRGRRKAMEAERRTMEG
jgi:hypothetical protein